MLVAGCSMLDKEKTFLIPFQLKTGFPLCYNKYPETSIQYLLVKGTTRCRNLT
jgi:hypothetical protein